MRRTLRLPPGAEDLFEASRRGLNAALGRGRWTVGGGSVLAARWGHRRSRDLDVFTTAEALARSMSREGAIAFRRRAPSIEWERAIRHWGRALKWENVRVGGETIGDVDVIAAHMGTPGPDRQRVRRSWVTAISTREILYGKTQYRGAEGLDRDLYDLACALREAPRAAEAALGDTSPTTLGWLRHHCRGREIAGRSVIAPRWPELLQEGPEEVGRAVDRILGTIDARGEAAPATARTPGAFEPTRETAGRAEKGERRPEPEDGGSR